MVISNKISKPDHPDLLMFNTPIPSVDTHKHLGIHYSSDGRWDKHIHSIISKVSTRLNIMRKLKFKLSRQALQIFYFSFIRPCLEYGNIVWCNISIGLSNELEQLNAEAARIVSGSTKLVSISKMFNELGWETLEERRRYHRLIFMYNIFYNKSPEYLSNIIPNRSFTQRSSRQQFTIPSILCRTSNYYNSYFPRAIREWNTLPPHACMLPIGTFKDFIRPVKPKTPSYYVHGERMPQLLLSRLRLGCSSLKSDLFRKGIIDSPYCICSNVIETANHYFFHCEKYTDLRRQYISNLTGVNTEILLHGDPSRSHHQNIEIADSVHHFILLSKRFERQ